ncbi:hypothetical protein DFH28DRAFT_928178 [Melampsora americana]|nr:hypothetical protein DFH28DRAFT_928178 [Melampsora americana]
MPEYTDEFLPESKSSGNPCQPGPSFLEKTLTLPTLKRAHQKDADEAAPRELEHHCSVTFAKDFQSNLKRNSQILDSTTIEAMDEETDYNLIPSKHSQLSHTSDSAEIEVESSS